MIFPERIEPGFDDLLNILGVGFYKLILSGQIGAEPRDPLGLL
jgi:hypothetical protein